MLTSYELANYYQYMNVNQRKDKGSFQKYLFSKEGLLLHGTYCYFIPYKAHADPESFVQVLGNVFFCFFVVVFFGERVRGLLKQLAIEIGL